MTSIKSEAAAIVEQWLLNNDSTQLLPAEHHSTTSRQSTVNIHTREDHVTNDHVTNDYVTKLDWDSEKVVDNVQVILSGLRHTQVKLPSDHTPSYRPKGDGPLISMQLRHEEVRKRRKDKDHAHMLALKEEQRQNDIRQKAWHLMKLEEKERKAREKREEEEIQKHIRAIRLQVQEQKEREKVVKQLLEKEEREKSEKVKKKEHQNKINISKKSHQTATQNKGGKLVQKEEELTKKKGVELVQKEEELTEKKGVELVQKGEGLTGKGEESVQRMASQRDVNITRMILTKQLIEIETLETKTNLKLMRSSFMSWYSLVQERCAVRKRALVIGNWRILSRYWRGWRGVVKEAKTQRLARADAERLRKEKETVSLSERHFKLHLLLKCFIAWRGVVTAAKIHVTNDRQQMITSFLQTLTTAAANEEKENKEIIDKTVSNSKGVWSTARSQLDKVMNEGKRRAIKKVSAERTNEITRNPNTNTTQTHSHTTSPHTHTTQTDTHTTNPTTQTHSHTTQAHSHTTQTHSHTTQTHTDVITPIKHTKPLSLKKMEERTALMAERKLAREERRKKREKEIKDELAAQEEERLKEEREAKMAEIQKRKEEKRIAQEKEKQRLLRAEILAKQITQAKAHYHKQLLLTKGFTPWRRFIFKTRENIEKSHKHHNEILLIKSWKIWKEKMKETLVEKEEKAVKFHEKNILQNTFKAWRIYNEYCCQLMSYAVQMNGHLLMKKVFGGWERFTRQERISYWEKERRSRKHFEHQLKVSVFSAWRSYVPLSHDEKQQEVRRAELRRKVALWLPDYQPNITQD